MHRVIAERDFDETGVDEDLARDLLADMVRARVFDERALALQRRGWMSGYPSFEGQEASQIGAARALDDADWLFPTYRANAMQLTRGVPAADLLRFRRGFSEFEMGRDVNNFPQATPIATQLPHAVGAGMAAGHLGADHAICAYLGDGATSEGDFHEAMNFAGVFDAPVVFFCENNYWAISMAWADQSAAPSIADRAAAYGFDGVQVDGNDPLAVRETVGDALETARNGEPVLVESLTYRRGAHTTSDDPERYRGEPDLPDWRTADPIERYGAYLRDAGVVDEGFVADVRASADAAIDEAVADAEATMPDPDDVFEHAYGSPGTRVREQHRSVTDGTAGRQ